MADTTATETAGVPHIVKARHDYRGMRTAEHYFEVPLDHFAAGGETITVFAREYVSADHSEEAAAELPWLLCLIPCGADWFEQQIASQPPGAPQEPRCERTFGARQP